MYCTGGANTDLEALLHAARHAGGGPEHKHQDDDAEQARAGHTIALAAASLHTHPLKFQDSAASASEAESLGHS